MKRRTAMAIARAKKKAEYKGGHQVQSRYGLKRHNLLAALPYPYAEDDCPGHVASIDPKICARCGVHIDSLRP